MFKDLYQPPADQVRAISWNGDPVEYDTDLYGLVQNIGTGLIVNPYLEDQKLIHYIEEIPQTDKCVVWLYQETWVAKLFPSNWTPDAGYEEIKLAKPKLVWNRNPDLDRLMTFEDNPFGKFEPEPWDRDYKLIWYIDPRFNPLPDKVWTVSCQPVGRPVKGTKDMGYMVPDVNVEFNEHLPDLGINIDECCPPFWELTNECAYELDPIHQTGDRLWVVKFTPAYKKPRQWKWLGIVSPQFNVEYNPALSELSYDLDYTIPWHDFGYEHVWLLDNTHLTNNEPDMWAFKIRVSSDTVGSKIIGTISPKIEVEYNPDLPQLDYNIDYTIPWHDLGFEHVWMLDRKHLQNDEEDIWAVKVKASNNTSGSKFIGYVSPRIDYKYNSVLSKLAYDVDYTIPWYDLGYEHVWMLDSKHLQNGEEDIWAIKARASKKISGTKVVGFLGPKFEIQYNPDLPELRYDIDYTIPWHDLEYDHVWLLDRKHLQNGEEDIWAVKLSSTIKASKGTKIVGSVTPKISIEYNRKLPNLNFNLDYAIPWYDLGYEHVWMLGRKHLQNNEQDIWLVKTKCLTNALGEKLIGYIDPIIKVEYNDSLPKINHKLEYTIPWHDFQYIHTWYLDDGKETENKVWVAKMKGSPDASGEKIVGMVTPIFDKLDVIFISYKEPDAEKNWQRVLEKAPHAKRVDGVTGIFEAHKEAARLATTDMFYVVDGDAYLTDEWEFSYQPGIFDRDCTYIWYSKNPINNLTYGYGGVKLFPSQSVKKSKTWNTLDLATSITDKIKIIETISNYTNFNTDEFSTWRSVFRECVKLYVNNFYHPENYEHLLRLESWTKLNGSVAYATYVVDAATRAVQFARENIAYKNVLLQINNREWLMEQFEKVKASNGRKE